VVWKTIAQKEITTDIVQQLLSASVTDTLTGFISKAGKPFEAKLKVVGGEVKLDFGG
jgi:DNA topoisomerase-3